MYDLRNGMMKQKFEHHYFAPSKLKLTLLLSPDSLYCFAVLTFGTSCGCSIQPSHHAAFYVMVNKA